EQVDAAAAVATGRLLGDDPGDRFGGVLQVDLPDRDAMALLHFIADPRDEGIGAFVAGPGVPVDGLAARGGGDRVPAARFGLGAGAACERRHDDGSDRAQRSAPRWRGGNRRDGAVHAAAGVAAASRAAW